MMKEKRKNNKINLRDKIYCATFSKDAVDVAKEYGFGLELNHVCISKYLDSDKIEGTIADIYKDYEKLGSEKVILHGPFTEICPGSIDHRAVDLGLERLEEAYQLAQRLGLKSMVAHTGYMPMIYYWEWHLEKSMDFWRRFFENKGDFTIFVENVFEKEPEQMVELIDKFNDPRLKICMDVGHANAMTETAQVTEWIKILGHRIAHFHIHNNFGEKDTHSPLEEGNLDMDEILTTIAENCSEDVTLTLESTDCRSCAQWLDENGYLGD